MLTNLLDKDIKVNSLLGPKNITGISSDSRKIKPGMIFVALEGAKYRGNDYILEAINSGAVVIIYEDFINKKLLDLKVNFIKVDNSRYTLAKLASRFYKVQPENIISITGTNGKTSTAYFIYQLLKGIGVSSATIGTLGICSNFQNKVGTLTTPDPIDLHLELANLAKDGIEIVALEASSHGLAQYRLDGVKINIAVLTNISRDHLDYHKTVSSYVNAKKRLFLELLSKKGIAILNRDIKEYADFERICKKRNIKINSYGKHPDALWKILNINKNDSGQTINISVYEKSYAIKFTALGGFQAMNLLAAMASIATIGFPIKKIIDAAQNIDSPPGRLEEVEKLYNGSSIYVDYAHTPDALIAILKTLRLNFKGRIILLFGCGGDRDPGKRTLMGKIANKYSDKVVVTDDNPRTENASAIRKTILSECENAIEVSDRRKAIFFAVSLLASGDKLIVAGKGHETGQIIGDKVYPFSDSEIIKEACSKINESEDHAI